MGIVVVAAFAARAADLVPYPAVYPYTTLSEIGREDRQPIVVIVGPAGFDCDVTALHETHFAQAPMECRYLTR
jgi:hypothetical protein